MKPPPKQCPAHPLRTDLPPLTPRLAALPVDERGYPVPFFVAYVDGKPEFRMADAAKRHACHRDKLCWVCGQPLGRNLAFTIGPLCAITRTTAEPPEHVDCAEWSVKGCPFLAKPQMVRRGKDELREKWGKNVAGEMIDRNPGVTCIWQTRGFSLFNDRQGGVLIQVGEPTHVSWWREGRAATRAEVDESIRTGLPALRAMCPTQEDHAALDEAIAMAAKFLP